MAADAALLDTSVLVGSLHADDALHASCVEALRDHRGALFTTEAVLAESLYLLHGLHNGSSACLDFIIAGGAWIVPSSRISLQRCREIMNRYDDLPADFADATLVALADDLDVHVVLTLDRRDFSVYRDRAGKAFEIRP